MATLLETLGALLLALLVVDFVIGNSWANAAKHFFKRLSEIFLAGALMEPYHQNVRGVLNFADRKIGRFIPTLLIGATIFALFGVVYFSGGLVHAIHEQTPLPAVFFRNLFVFCLETES